MNNGTKPRYSSKDLSSRITEHIQELATATDEARVSEEMRRYLDTIARFHKYSPNNLWLILMAKPEATMVAGYHKWREMGRFVKKGEKGIAILAPVIIKDKDDIDEDNEKLVGFKVVYVFDLSQTDGEPLPKAPCWKSPEKNAELTERLIRFAEGNSIKVSIKQLSGDIQGISKGGAIVLSPDAGVKTLVHEIVHEILHHDNDRPENPTIRELEAESIAYVVSKHFGLDGLSSPNYNALHGATSEMIMQHLECIRSTAAKIITAIEED
jgi:hypothetical protein